MRKLKRGRLLLISAVLALVGVVGCSNARQGAEETPVEQKEQSAGLEELTASQEASELAGVQSFENLSSAHTEDAVTYEQTPPVGGDHNPVWQNAAFYGEAVANEKAVHTMEHGAVWITYAPDLPQDQKDKLRHVVESQDCLLASPYSDLPAPVVASAWGKQLQLQSVEDPNLQEFILAYQQGPQTREPGAPCTDAP